MVVAAWGRVRVVKAAEGRVGHSGGTRGGVGRGGKGRGMRWGTGSCPTHVTWSAATPTPKVRGGTRPHINIHALIQTHARMHG